MLRGSLIAACFVGLATISLASTSRAQSSPAAGMPAAGDDVVYLRNGGLLRGTLTEILPNNHATLTLSSGQTATVQWAQIERIERGARALGAPLPAAEAPAPVKSVWVHIESDRPLRLEARGANGKSWIPVCNSPCDQMAPLVATYRIVGDGVRSTYLFGLEGNPGDSVLIEVDPASKAGFVGGIVLVSVSPIVSLIGLLVIAVNSISNDTGTGGGSSTGGIALTVGGLVGIGAGIALLVSNSSSKETQSLRAPAKATAAATREPIWRDTGPVPAAPPQAMIPLFTF